MYLTCLAAQAEPERSSRAGLKLSPATRKRIRRRRFKKLAAPGDDLSHHFEVLGVQVLPSVCDTIDEDHTRSLRFAGGSANGLSATDAYGTEPLAGDVNQRIRSSQVRRDNLTGALGWQS